MTQTIYKIEPKIPSGRAVLVVYKNGLLCETKLIGEGWDTEKIKAMFMLTPITEELAVNDQNSKITFTKIV